MFSPEVETELRAWMGLAVPLCLTLLARTGMMLTDVSVLGLWDSEYLGAVGVASLYTTLTSVIVWRGLLEALNTLCGQAYGAKNFRLVGLWLSIGLQMGLFVTILVGSSWLYAGDVLQHLANYDDVEKDRVNTFCRYSLIGLLPFIFYVGVSNFLGTLHIVKPLLYINIASLFLNLALNWILVTGWLGFTGFGYEGSPIATTITRVIVMVMTWVWITSAVNQDPKSDLANCWPGKLRDLLFPPWSTVEEHVDENGVLQQKSKSLIGEFSAVAFPIAFGSLLEEAQIQLIGLMAARLGDEEMATHNAILQVFFLLSSFIWATSSATQVRISTHLGSGNYVKAKLSLRIGTVIALICGSFVALVFIGANKHLADLYSHDAPEVKRLTGEISYLVGLGYLGLTQFYISMACLNAQARVGQVVIAFIVGAWFVAVPLAYVFAFVVEPTKGLIGLWLGLCCGYMTVTIISMYAVYKSDWEALTKEAVERSNRGRSRSLQMLEEPFLQLS